MAVEQLDPTDLDPIQRTVNRSMMVAWINADLVSRAPHDVRKSIVLYDEDCMFVYALQNMPDEELLQEIGERTSVRFYSEGV